MENRVTVHLRRPNPLFEKWLEELLMTGTEGSRRKHKLQIALNSLRKYPLVLKSGSECAILNGFGKSLCQILDKRISQHRFPLSSCSVDLDTKEVAKNVEVVAHSRSPGGNKRSHPENDKGSKSAEKKRKHDYIPKYRSGAYAILVALYKKKVEADMECYMFKDELMFESQKYCDESVSKPKPGSHYTAWSSMKILLTKNLVVKERSKKIKFMLTNSGFDLANKLVLNSDKNEVENLSFDGLLKPKPTVSNIFRNVNINQQTATITESRLLPTHGTACSGSDDMQVVQIEPDVPKVNEDCDKDNKVTPDVPCMSFGPGTFDVILLVDKQETSGAAKKDDATVRELEKYKMIKYELRHLKVGDFTWVARHRIHGGELVLPHIVERKRMDDLGSSIRDGRFHEQKYRLKQCGIPNVMYLLESYGDNRRTGLPLSTLMQAAANTRIQDGFMTHFTSSLSHSIRFLAMMTGNMIEKYGMKTLVSSHSNEFTGSMESDILSLVEFNHFNAMASKTKVLTVTDMFIKQLLQLKGVSVEKAVAIASEYKTPYNLMKTYENMTADQKPELLLTKITNRAAKSKIGPTISKTIYLYFTTEKLV